MPTGAKQTGSDDVDLANGRCWLWARDGKNEGCPSAHGQVGLWDYLQERDALLPHTKALMLLMRPYNQMSTEPRTDAGGHGVDMKSKRRFIKNLTAAERDLSERHGDFSLFAACFR